MPRLASSARLSYQILYTTPTNTYNYATITKDNLASALWRSGRLVRIRLCEGTQSNGTENYKYLGILKMTVVPSF